MNAQPHQAPQLLNHALKLAALGCHVFPLQARGKQPATTHGVKDATRNENQIREWWTWTPDANIGVACGPSNLLVVDIDGPDASTAWDQLGAHTPTYTVATGRGRHLYYHHDHQARRLGNTASKLAPGIDTRGDGGYVLAATSIHPTGRTYDHVAGTQPAPLPDQLLQLLDPPAAARRNSTSPAPVGARSPDAYTRYVDTAIDGETTRVANAGEGNRNHTLNEAAFNLGTLVGAHVLDPAHAEHALERAAAACGLTEREAARTIQSGLAAGERSPRQLPAPQAAANGGHLPPRDPIDHPDLPPPDDPGIETTFHGPDDPNNTPPPPASTAGDDGTEIDEVLGIAWTGGGETFHAALFVDEHHDVIRHATGTGWLSWDGSRWNHDDGDKAMTGRFRATNERLRQHAGTLNKKRRNILRQEARGAVARARMVGALGYAAADERVSVPTWALDNDPLVLNARNGTIELETGHLREHDPDNLITKRVGVDYDPDATDETLDRFLDDLVGGDRELLAFLQRMLGYGISGLSDEEKALYGHGPGGTGKTTLLEALKAVLGDYAVAVDVDLLTKAPNNRGGMGPSPELLKLRGARMAFVNEPDEGSHLAAGRFKAITSGDTMTARFMHSNTLVEFRPCALVVFAANHRMKASAHDSGIWRRMVQFPFTNTPARRDPNLKARLLRPAAQRALLAWLVEGYRLWRRDGLELPARVAAYTAEYQRESDRLADWIDDNLVFEAGLTCPSGVLYQDYLSWAEVSGEKRPLGRARWMEELGQREGAVYTRSKNLRFWRGVTIRSAYVPGDPSLADLPGDADDAHSRKDARVELPGMVSPASPLVTPNGPGDAEGDAATSGRVTPQTQAHTGNPAPGDAGDAQKPPFSYMREETSNSLAHVSPTGENGVTGVTSPGNALPHRENGVTPNENAASPARHPRHHGTDDIDNGDLW